MGSFHQVPEKQTGPPHVGVRPLKVPAIAHCGTAGTGGSSWLDHRAARRDGDWTLDPSLCPACVPQPEQSIPARTLKSRPFAVPGLVPFSSLVSWHSFS